MPGNTLSLDDLKPLVADAAGEFGIPEDSIWRKVRAENSGSVQGAANLKQVRTDAVSPKDAKGIMQVTQVALDDVIGQGLIPSGTKLDGLSPKDQVRIGAAYIKRLRDSYSTDPAIEDAMYNFGPKARFQMDRLPQETQDYLKKTGATMADGTDTSSNSSPQASTYGAGMMDSKGLLSALLGNNQRQNANIQQGAEEYGALQQQADIKRSAAVAGQKSAIEGAAATAASEADIAFQQAQLGEQLQKMFNLDPTQVNNEISTSLAQAQVAKDARASVRAEFDAASTANFFDDPLGYLVSQVKLPQLAKQNNALADAEDLALNNIQTKTAMLKAAQNTLVANTADQVKEVALQKAKNIQVLSEAKVSEEEAKNITASANSKLQLVGLTDKMGDNARATIGTVISLQDREEQASLRNTVKKEATDRKAMEAADEARLDGRLKLVSDSLGLAEPMTVRRLKTLQSKKDQDVWLNAALSGQMGDDLQSSLGFYLGSGNRVAIANQGGATTFQAASKMADAGAGYQSVAERAAMAANPAGKKPTSADSKAMGYKLYQDSVVDSMRSPTDKTDLSSSTWDKTYNPYVAPMKAFTTAINNPAYPELAGLKNNAMTTAIVTLLGTGAVTGENLTASQQQQVIGSISKLVEARTITPAKAAADISVYTSAASAWNRRVTGYTLFSLPIQESYLFTMDGEFNRQKVDLMNPATLENALMKRAMESRKVNAPYGSPFGGFR